MDTPWSGQPGQAPNPSDYGAALPQRPEAIAQNQQPDADRRRPEPGRRMAAGMTCGGFGLRL